MKITDKEYKLKGYDLLIRNACPSDASDLIGFMKRVCEETDYLNKQPDEIDISVDDEIDIINSIIRSINEILLVAVVNNEIIGSCSLNIYRYRRVRHRANMAIAVLRKYNGLGIGTTLISVLKELAIDNKIECIDLEVHAANYRAINLYKKMGFRVIGKMRHSMKYDEGQYADSLFMLLDMGRPNF